MKRTELTYADWITAQKALAPPEGSFTIGDVARDMGITYAMAEGRVENGVKDGSIKALGFLPDGKHAKRRYYIVVQPTDIPLNGKGKKKGKA